MSMSQPLTMSERRGLLSLNGGKKSGKSSAAGESELNGNKSKKDSQKSQNGVEKPEKNGNNDVIILDDDDLPLSQHKKSLVNNETPNNEPVVVVAEEQSTIKNAPEAEDNKPSNKESTPKKKSSSKSEKKTTPKPAVDEEKQKKEDEMLAAVFADENPFDEEKKKDTKVLKLTSDLLSSKRRSDRIQNASTIVNLSTVSVSEMTKPDVTADMEVDAHESYVPVRKVSGRRSTRPMNEIQFTYRTRNPDETLNSSVNATIGSEIHTSILQTPGSFLFRSKRTLSDENIESPKRARLDFSGLFTAMTSPVTMLRDRFRRAKIQSSTPNKQEEAEASIDELDASVEEDTTEKTDEEKPAETANEEDKPTEESPEAEAAEEQEEAPVASKKRCSIM